MIISKAIDSSRRKIPLRVSPRLGADGFLRNALYAAYFYYGAVGPIKFVPTTRKQREWRESQSKTWMEIAKEELHKYNLPEQTLEFLIWEKTGFPEFFDTSNGETAEEVFRRQLREAMAK